MTASHQRDGAPKRTAVHPTVVLLLLVIGLVSTADALGIFWRDMDRRDFGAFYYSGRAWNSGEAIYQSGRADLPNLNPPAVVALVFAPLARLPLRAAGVLWQMLGAAALAFCAWRVAHAVSLPRREALFACSVLLVSVPARYVWLEGQITWMLLIPATESWLAYRRKAFVAAGFWLSPVIAAKPFFALTGLALGVPALLAAGAGSLALTVLGMTVTSPGLLQEWLSLGPRISVTWPSSASLWTLGARLRGAKPLDVFIWTDLPAPVVALFAIVALALLFLAYRQRDLDARWVAAVAIALLLSPLGWIYYLPLAAGALTALWSTGRWSAWLTAAVLALCLPMIVLFRAIDQSWWAAATLGAAYTWALLTIGVCAVRLPVTVGAHPESG